LVAFLAFTSRIELPGFVPFLRPKDELPELPDILGILDLAERNTKGSITIEPNVT
jgi:hypothetical protein